MTTPEKVREDIGFEDKFNIPDYLFFDMHVCRYRIKAWLDREQFYEQVCDSFNLRLEGWRRAIESQSSIIDGLRKDIGDKVFKAVIDCPHEIDDRCIKLFEHESQDNDNALHQLHARIVSALATLPTPGERNNG